MFINDCSSSKKWKKELLIQELNRSDPPPNPPALFDGLINAGCLETASLAFGGAVCEREKGGVVWRPGCIMRWKLKFGWKFKGMKVEICELYFQPLFERAHSSKYI